MFQCYDDWEEEDDREMLRAVFEQPTLRRHPLIEVVGNPYLVHIDAVLDDDDKELQLWQRFICTDLVRTAAFLKDNAFAHCRLSVQDVHDSAGPYVMHEITHVTEGFDRNGLHYIGFYTKSGKMFTHIPVGASIALEDRRARVWPSESCPR
jgi:hypothetical protein